MEDGMTSRTVVLPILVLVAIAFVGVTIFTGGTQTVPESQERGAGVFHEDFSTGFIDPERWSVTMAGDATERIIEVNSTGPSADGNYRLCIGADTIGTEDDTVKYQGIRTVQPIPFDGKRTVFVDLDWNHQWNGCYLSAGFYLCPTVTETNPEEEPDWLKFTYVGVPPGVNVRPFIASKRNGHVSYLYLEGWPEEKSGRPIDNQRVQIISHDGQIHVRENDTELFRSDNAVIDFSSAYLYLQTSSHSNYPLRVICFDNITVL